MLLQVMPSAGQEGSQGRRDPGAGGILGQEGSRDRRDPRAGGILGQEGFQGEEFGQFPTSPLGDRSAVVASQLLLPLFLGSQARELIQLEIILVRKKIMVDEV